MSSFPELLPGQTSSVLGVGLSSFESFMASLARTLHITHSGRGACYSPVAMTLLVSPLSKKVITVCGAFLPGLACRLHEARKTPESQRCGSGAQADVAISSK